MKLSDLFRRRRGGLAKRYMRIYSGTLIVCTIMLGVMLLSFCAQYFRQQKDSSLRDAAARTDLLIMEDLTSHGGLYVVRSDVEKNMALVEVATGTTVFFCDLNGHVAMCCEGDACVHVASALSERVMRKIAIGPYSVIGNLSGFLQDPHYIYGEPFVIGGVLQGYILAVSPISEIFGFLVQMGVLFLLSMLLMLMASSIVINYSTGLLVQPLEAISRAASAFGSGNLAARVKVTGDDEIANLARVFNDMADSVEELENTRRSFVANLSHELRTPMTTISGYIDGILDGTIPYEQQNKYLGIALDEMKRLSRLTQSLLDIARMEAATEPAALAEMNAWDIILSVMLGSERRISEKNIEVPELDIKPLPVLCNPDMLHQIIHNLVDNAIKFTPEGGKLSVRAEGVGDRMRIHVRNSGDGISPEDLPRVFERFYKSDKSRALDKSGTGLGLYIVKMLAERMDGSIRVESEYGSYAEFIVELRSPAPKELSKPQTTSRTYQFLKVGRKPKNEAKEQPKDE